MNNELVAPLIDEAIRMSPRAINTDEKNIRIGQIRRIAHPSKPISSRYVLVLNINPIRQVATVVLLNNLTNLATDRDYILPRKKSLAAFDLTIFADFIESTDYKLIEKNPVIGSLCPICARIIYEAKKSPSDQMPVFPNNHSCITSGRFRIQIADSTWYLRNIEFELFQKICEIPDEIEALIREGKFIQKYRDQEDFISASMNEFNTTNILALDDATFDLLR
jgi:hypothetical protein